MDNEGFIIPPTALKPKRLQKLKGVVDSLKKIYGKLRFFIKSRVLIFKRRLLVYKRTKTDEDFNVLDINCYKKFILKHWIIIGSAAIVVAFLAVAFGVFYDRKTSTNSPTTKVLSAVNSSNQQTLPREKPSFTILYPGGNTSEIIGDLVRSSPSGSAPAYRFYDKIGDVVISVTQQEIPESFKSNIEEQLEKLARDFQANNVIVIDGSKIYHGRKESSNEQSLILTKANRLIFIIAEKALSDDSWVGYITNLR